MTTPHEPRPAPPYGQEAAYAAHPDAVRGTAGAPATARAEAPSQHDVPDASGDAAPGRAGQHGYGTPPQPGGYGTPPQPGGYGTPPQPGGYGTPPPYGYPAPGYRPSPPRNDLAVWSLVLGIVGVLGCVFLTGVPAIVLGNNARRAVAAGEADNGGMATAGIVLGWVATALGAALVVLVVLLSVLPLLFLGMVPFLGGTP